MIIPIPVYYGNFTISSTVYWWLLGVSTFFCIISFLLTRKCYEKTGVPTVKKRHKFRFWHYIINIVILPIPVINVAVTFASTFILIADGTHDYDDYYIDSKLVKFLVKRI